MARTALYRFIVRQTRNSSSYTSLAQVQSELIIQVHYVTSLAQVQTSSQKEDFHYLHHTNNTKAAETFPAWDDQVKLPTRSMELKGMLSNLQGTSVGCTNYHVMQYMLANYKFTKTGEFFKGFHCRHSRSRS
jgi:hypothetical protein